MKGVYGEVKQKEEDGKEEKGRKKGKENRLGSPSERRFGRVKKKMKMKNEKNLLKKKY